MKQILIQKPQWGRLASFALLIMCLPLISCNTNKASENKESSALTDSIKEGLIAKNDTIEEESADKTDYAATQNEADLIPILIPGGRYDPGTLETAIDKTWMEFYRDTITGDYHVDKAQYVISSYYDDCLELNQGGLDSPRNCLFYLNMPTLKAGKVDSVSIGRGYIEPKTPFVIDFNGARYTLQVEAKTSEDTLYQAGEEYGDWKDYRMTLKKDNNPEILLFKIPEFKDSVLRLLFAGDIDKDGKLDLVFDAHTWYEEANITVFLSSLATDGILVKAASFSIQYDC